MKLVASMIVRNELDRYLLPCLEHLLSYVDEVRIVDDGSTDNWTRVVYDPAFGWPADRIYVHRLPRSEFYEHEGKARQTLLQWTLDSSPTHVLAIDADEFVDDPEALLSAIDEGWPVLRLCMMEVWGCDADGLRFRIDGGWKPHDAPLVYEVGAGARETWRIPDKQLASGRIPNEVLKQRARSSGVGIYHFGWACQSDRAARHARYVEHDSGQFHAGSHLDSIMWADGDPRLRLCRDPWPKGLEAVRGRIVERSNR